MRLFRHSDPATFLAAAGDFLGGDEALYNLPLSVARTCRDDPGRHRGANYFAVIEEADRVVGVAVMTPPYQVQFYAPAAAAEAVVEDLDRVGCDLPGANGPVGCVDAFAEGWCARRSLPMRVSRNLRSFSLARVIAVPAPPGRMRAAGEGDLAAVEGFYRGFIDEASHGMAGDPPEEIARCALREGRVVLWEDGGRPVSQAAASGTTPNGARVGAVYTPPGFRRRGYATALVGALSARLLAEGKRFCLLFTDLANPISNSIYPRVGYRPVGEFREFEFREAP